jgi:cellulose synthase/poly-beta-1,6-N-acetylglucosamine synthase-like glycosyltransferase
MAIWLIGAGSLCLLAALHPFTTYPLTLLLLRTFKRQPLPPVALSARSEGAAPLVPADAPEMAILVCAYNEERVIEAKIENMLALKRAYPKLSIYVYVDCASDRTAQLLEPYRDQIYLHVAPERMGKSYGMNLLMEQVQAPFVIFTDANVTLDPQVTTRLLRYFADPKIGCVCGHLQYTNAGESITASSGSLYWRFDEWTKRVETATGSAMGADGSLFAIRRGLHRPTPVDMFDDIYVSMMILCAGYRLVQADDVNALEESVPSRSEEFQRKIRIGCQAYNAHLLLWPSIRRLDLLNVYKYVSHKWLRWLTIYFLLAAAVFFEAGLVALGMQVVALVLLGAGLLCLIAGYFSLARPLAQGWDILTAFVGTGVGVLNALRGQRFQTWAPAASIRK